MIHIIHFTATKVGGAFPPLALWLPRPCVTPSRGEVAATGIILLAKNIKTPAYDVNRLISDATTERTAADARWEVLYALTAATYDILQENLPYRSIGTFYRHKPASTARLTKYQ